ncbi:hypothetical protein Glove_86g50 [Diversispora epigaea]|uniref:Serine-threonine/tyrosine-protein kinase catalytic domain-containing protein n=1 Tax=Diversispora epigaea TaxID=1348612 RepID=A0A397J6G6_9GLOM|nr:hypothetical protein Glove_86g50 [Diversispora epigaea]
MSQEIEKIVYCLAGHSSNDFRCFYYPDGGLYSAELKGGIKQSCNLIVYEFTRKSDIYSFGGIMYEIVTAQQPFANQAHDTYLMIDLYLMYRCWGDDHSERPTIDELIINLFVIWLIIMLCNNLRLLMRINEMHQNLKSKSGKSSWNNLF